MKNLIAALALALALLAASAGAAQSPEKLPDISGFHTLHCDFHMHTLFSDGKVWPDIRVLEARDENLDCIAITDHLKYNKTSKQGKHPEVSGSRDRSFEIAHDAAAETDVIVIRGAEITQGMPPGHINAVFLETADIAQPDYLDTLSVARDQGAFLFWNHPSWKSPDKKWEQDATAQWFEVHSELLASNRLHGIEVVNGRAYSREAHQWAIEKNLAVLGTTDIHLPIAHEYDLTREHRPLTLVFATERNEESIREALFARRTAVWFENGLIGSQEWLGPLFEACIEQSEAAYLENLAIATLTNHCSLDFFVENTGEYSLYNRTRFIELRAGEQTGLAIKTGERMNAFELGLSVRNLHTAPDEVLRARLAFTASGEITDKKLLERMARD